MLPQRDARGAAPREMIPLPFVTRATTARLSVRLDNVSRCSTCAWQHKSCSMWSQVTTSVPVYDNCTDCQSLNESHMSAVLSSTTQQLDKLTSYITDLVQPPCTTSSRSSLPAEPRVVQTRLCLATDEPTTRRSNILHCCTTSVELSTYLKMTQLTSSLRPSGTEDFSFPSRYSCE